MNKPLSKPPYVVITICPMSATIYKYLSQVCQHTGISRTKLSAFFKKHSYYANSEYQIFKAEFN